MLLFVPCIYTSLASKMIELTNQYRQEHKLDPLTCLDVLNRAAQYQADYMCKSNYLTHKNPMKKSLSDRLLSFDYVGDKIGENIAKQNGDDYKQVFDVWISSQPHNDNIKGNYRHLGIGTCKNDENERYWVQVFGKKKTGQCNERKEHCEDNNNKCREIPSKLIVKKNEIFYDANKRRLELKRNLQNRPRYEILDDIHNTLIKGGTHHDIERHRDRLIEEHYRPHHKNEYRDMLKPEDIKNHISQIVTSIIHENKEHDGCMEKKLVDDIKLTMSAPHSHSSTSSTDSLSFFATVTILTGQNDLKQKSTQKPVVFTQTNTNHDCSILSSIYNKDATVSLNMLNALCLLTSIGNDINTIERNLSSKTLSHSTTNILSLESDRTTSQYDNSKVKSEILDLLDILTQSDSNLEIAGIPIQTIMTTLISEIEAKFVCKTQRKDETISIGNFATRSLPTTNTQQTIPSITSISDNIFKSQSSSIISTKGIADLTKNYDKDDLEPYNSYLHYFLQKIKNKQSSKTDQPSTSVVNMPVLQKPDLIVSPTPSVDTSSKLPKQSMLLYEMGSNNIRDRKNQSEISRIESELTKMSQTYSDANMHKTMDPMESLILSFGDTRTESRTNAQSQTNDNRILSILDYSDMKSMQGFPSSNVPSLSIDRRNSTTNSIDLTSEYLRGVSDSVNLCPATSINKADIMNSQIPTTQTSTSNFAQVDPFTKLRISGKISDYFNKIINRSCSTDMTNRSAFYNQLDTIDTSGDNRFDIPPKIDADPFTLHRPDRPLEQRQYEPQYNYNKDDYFPLMTLPKSINRNSIQPTSDQNLFRENPKTVKDNPYDNNYYSGSIDDLKKLLNNQQYKDRHIKIVFGDGKGLTLSDIEVGDSIQCGS